MKAAEVLIRTKFFVNRRKSQRHVRLVESGTTIHLMDRENLKTAQQLRRIFLLHALGPREITDDRVGGGFFVMATRQKGHPVDWHDLSRTLENDLGLYPKKTEPNGKGSGVFNFELIPIEN